MFLDSSQRGPFGTLGICRDYKGLGGGGGGGGGRFAGKDIRVASRKSYIAKLLHHLQ